MPSRYLTAWTCNLVDMSRHPAGAYDGVNAASSALVSDQNQESFISDVLLNDGTIHPPEGAALVDQIENIEAPKSCKGSHGGSKVGKCRTLACGDARPTTGNPSFRRSSTR